MSELEELRDSLSIDLSTILNDTKAYTKIIDMVKEKYNIDLHDYDYIFSEIEFAIAEMILTVEEDN
jgi:uncharacterized protein YfbU (UPF0304 family)